MAVIEAPLPPPEWALLQRSVLDTNSRAVEEFAAKHMDSRGYLLHTPRRGTLDGPDDAIETFHNWTLPRALGRAASILDLFLKGLEVHLAHYRELRTELTQLALHGACGRDLITRSVWFHRVEGMRGSLLYGLSAPVDPVPVDRMKRFARMYTGEDPLAPNYDPSNEVIKSLWTGSQGPVLRNNNLRPGVGDPVAGRFHILHGPDGRGKTLDLVAW